MYFCAEIKQTQFCYNYHVLYIDILKELYVYIYIYIYRYIVFNSLCSAKGSSDFLCDYCQFNCSECFLAGNYQTLHLSPNDLLLLLLLF